MFTAHKAAAYLCVADPHTEYKFTEAVPVVTGYADVAEESNWCTVDV